MSIPNLRAIEPVRPVRNAVSDSQGTSLADWYTAPGRATTNLSH